MSYIECEVRTLGVGSFGRVKYGKYKGDGNMYAVKFMKKHEIIKLKQVDHINAERNLMMQIHHPFAVNMIGAFKDDRYILGILSFSIFFDTFGIVSFR